MKTVLITGTTSGIGYSLCECFAKKQYDLVLVSRNIEKLSRQKAELERFGIRVHILAKDLSEKDAAMEVYAFTKDENLSIDILVNNAGLNECGQFKDTSIQKELELLEVHVLTLTQLTKFYLNDMIAQGGGKILNLGSTGSFSPFPYDAVYAASKAYVLSFSKAINSELKGTGVSVTALCPGATRTEFAKKAKIENTLLFKAFVSSPDKVAETALRALEKKKSVAVVGLYNKLQVCSMKILPYPIVAKLSYMFFKQ